MQCFAIVRDAEALARACEDLSDLLEWTRRAGDDAPELLGIWLDPAQVVEVPASLGPVGPVDRNRGPWQIAASAGLSGLWTLCWIEGPPLDRRTLVTALDGTGSGAGGFHPVFGREAIGSAHHRELGALAERRGDLIRSPLFLDGESGRLAPPSEPTRWRRAQSS